VKVCPTAVHEEIKRSPDAWARLPLVAVRDYGKTKLEIRNCNADDCGSTLAIEIGAQPDQE